MLRLLGSLCRDNAKNCLRTTAPKVLSNDAKISATTSILPQLRCLSILSKQTQLSSSLNNATQSCGILSTSLGKLLLPQAQPSAVPCRTVTKFSLRTAKRKSVKTVLRRFYRLHWGIWIHTRSGRHRHLWKKRAKRKKRLRTHVFCNATQSRLLDKMVTMFWRRPKYYPDDIYNPYHTREEFYFTNRKPKPLPGHYPDY
ncbi:39S ribosomal protein L35, mitochondrial [Trichogramma pretiosum]|uniref:39S ribosomal protein L35, mitochondrial n=1 Tax=Trichogramma pretiosum TaxID=7493 RepID=UPI0006C9BA77|nr:39S ribosomal protein L35, mitochondrial [Trichogramma pretiosum]